jgi:hypothetical protein
VAQYRARPAEPLLPESLRHQYHRHSSLENIG